jgi:glycoside/pentoside/hexuronide:cation symporter, GPH family
VTAPAIGARPQVGIVTQALYGLGGLGAASKAQLFGFLLIFYTQYVGLDFPMVSLAIAIALFIDAFWDPIVGQLSDNTHSRLGRRHPYIYAAIVPAAIAFVLLFRPPMDWSEDQLFLYLVLLVVAGRMFDSLHEIPNSALLPELTSDYDKRNGVQAWRYFFGATAGRLLAITIGFGIFLKATPGNKYGQLNFGQYEPYAVTAAIISVVVVVISALATQRFVPFMHVPERRKPSLGAIAGEIGRSISNKNFVALAASAMIFGISVGISGGLVSYFYTYFWELGSHDLQLLGYWSVPAGFVGIVLAPYGARMFGKKYACIITFFLAIFSTTVPITLRLLGVMPPNSSPWVLRILIVDAMSTAALASFGFVIVGSMLADVVEDVQMQTGRRSEGLLFAADSLLRKLTTSFAALLPGLLLAFVHFPKGRVTPGQVDPHVLNELALIYLPITTVLCLCSTSAIMLYGIDRKQHEMTLERLNDAAAGTELLDPVANP